MPISQGVLPSQRRVKQATRSRLATANWRGWRIAVTNPRELITLPPVIDLMAALKRSLAQDVPAMGNSSLLLPVAGAGKRQREPAAAPDAITMRPRKKASRLA